MNKEELDSFEELNINLQDIDDLDMGLEIISYKVRKSLQELADIRLNRIMLPKWFITKNGYNYTMEVYEDRIILIANKEKINNEKL